MLKGSSRSSSVFPAEASLALPLRDRIAVRMVSAKTEGMNMTEICQGVDNNVWEKGGWRIIMHALWRGGRSSA
jgi:hypothetical protein